MKQPTKNLVIGNIDGKISHILCPQTLNDLKKFINEFSKFEQNFEVCFASDNEGNSIANFNGECSTAKTKDGKPIVILYPSHDQILDWEE